MSAAGQKTALGSAEAVDLLCDEALVEGDARLLDLVLARPAAALLHDAPVRRGECRVAEECARLGRRKVEVARAWPRRDELRVERDRRSDALVQRVAVLGVADRELEDIGEPPGPEVAQEEEPAAERARDAGREHARSRDQLVAELVEPLDRRGRWCHALAAERERLSALHRPRTRPASPRRARSGAAPRPGARTRSRRRRRRRCRLVRAPTSRPATRASGSTRPSRRCRGARVAW